MTDEWTKQISDLKNRVDKLEQERDELNRAVHELYQINNELVKHMGQTFENMTTLDMNQNLTRVRCENLRYEITDPRDERTDYFFPQIRSCEETVQEILQNRVSMARFGDGEFSCIRKMERHKFQTVNEKLADRLEEVLHSRHPKLLIAIADNYGALDQFTESAANAIRFYMVGGETRKQHMELLERERVYYNAYVTRPYVMYQDVGTDAPKRRFERLKEIWRGRNVVLIEGAQTRMGVGNDLLEHAGEVKRILAPVTNAFDQYENLLDCALAYAKQDTLFLIAVGPCAGVLAYDLTCKGYQALDIGHLDLEYEWFLAGQGERVAVPYKYNNEVEGDDCAAELVDPVYQKQIIADYSY